MHSSVQRNYKVMSRQRRENCQLCVAVAIRAMNCAF